MLRCCLILFFKLSILLLIGISTLNTVLSPSMRHQRVDIDIRGGSDKLEKVKERRGGGRSERIGEVAWREQLNDYQQVSININ